MTPDQAREAAHLIEDMNTQLQKYFGDNFEGARGPLRDHCFGYSCGTGVAACVAITEAMRQVRVALLQVETAQRQMSANQ